LLVLALPEWGATSLAVNVTNPSFSAAQSLTLLVTMESLLFAASTVALTLGRPVAGGSGISAKGAYRLACAVVAALSTIASGAVMGWWQVFADHWPESTLRALEAIAILIGISAQPLVSFATARAIKP